MKNKNGGMPKQKKPIDKRKIFGVLGIILSAVIAFVALPMINGQKNNTERLYVASGIIEKGALITEENVSLKEIGTYGISGYFKESDKEKLLGQRASIDMLKGDIVTKEKLGGVDESTVSSITEGDSRLVTLSVKTNAAGLATHLKAGDIVNVWTKVEEEDEWGQSYDVVVLPNELREIEVYSAENSSGYSTEGTGEDDNIVSTVTFIAKNEAVSKALIQAEYEGGIHMELVKRPSAFSSN